ncbi:hypothetical protein [Dokdonia sp. Hel_I_53]|uniref:hypothetical protein n=1 Tax=Dokdonia sp. Hel_I_53 TaxID=1566287 RepID=UPI00119AC1AA|nr:hypothetical protein [Dokdonia sp. Hel_I_53]TVZ52688.1 hypothetical protein OD90_1872 [Dokdonia sp. Hel_I_53]
MKSLFIYFLIVFNSFSIIAQQDSIFIKMDKSITLTVDKAYNYSLELLIASDDKHFSFDNYKFQPFNRIEFDKVPLSQVEKPFILGTKITSISDFKKLSPCKLHELLSGARQIYFVRRNLDRELVFFNAIYTGTVKNLQTLKIGH